MQIGAVLPQTEIGGAVADVRRYATTVEQLGYAHLLAYDHVLGADPEAHAPWNGPYDVDTTFHEPFVLFGYLAACTRLELVSGIIILPQRQTALVAKQAAEVDLLAEGRFRLGVGLGWNPIEYEALGQSFADRGRRMSEQIPLLRRLLSEHAVTHDGEFDRIRAAGLSPQPIQRPIPIWIGGESPPAYRRIGRLGDGWFPQMAPGPKLDEARSIIADAAVAAGRDPATLGMEGRVNLRAGGVAQLADHVGRWRDAGATHVGINTMNAGLGPVDRHLEVLAELAATIGLRGMRGPG
jgi:probable F420-dependent oxidoreductase